MLFPSLPTTTTSSAASAPPLPLRYNSSATPAPQPARFITITSNLDNKLQCTVSKPGDAGGFTYYFTTKVNACFTTGAASYKFAVSNTGITPTVCAGTTCNSGCRAYPAVGFGECWAAGSMTLGLAWHLPGPIPEYALRHVCLSAPTTTPPHNCQCDETYVLERLGCYGPGAWDPYSTDFAYLCRPAQPSPDPRAEFTQYAMYSFTSRTGHCEGTPTMHSTFNLGQCSIYPGSASTPIWCGAGCKKYETWSLTQPYCDPPSYTTKWAIDLDSVFGPSCLTSMTSVGACCYVPLGYGGGPAFGTACDVACAHYGRKGRADTFCSNSQYSNYGNC